MGRGKGRPVVKYGDTVLRCTTELIEMSFETWTWVGPRKHVLARVHTGATWRIPLNRPCAAAMRPVLKIL